MIVEQFPNFLTFLFQGGDGRPGAIVTFLLLAAACLVIGTFVGYLIAVVRHGPFEAFYVVASVIARSGPDLFRISPRRVLAIARLSAKEAMRRRVILVAFLIFALALLFGGWFVNTGSDHPERVYVNFVMWGTQLIVLMMVLLISAFSLPDDIKNKTIHTVVTKPVRASEIVLGRMLGFVGVGSGLLLLMAVISLLFVWRGLAHSHQLDGPTQTVADFVPIDAATTGRRASESAISEAWTTQDGGHRHLLEIVQDIREKGAAAPANMESVFKVEELDDRTIYYRVIVRPTGGHTHTVQFQGQGDNAKLTISGAKGFFRARVPVYAKQLTFFDRQGNPRQTVDPQTGETRNEGLNVGYSWTYRGFVDGGATLSRAEFLFDDFRSSLFGDSDLIPLELTLAVFRTHKGDIEKRIRVSIQLESVPDDEQTENRFRSDAIEFESAEHEVQVKGIPRSLPGQLISPEGNVVQSGYVDLFKDLAANGKLRVLLRCEERGQYVGVAQADVYFRAAEGIYWTNFLKGYAGIWLQMLVVVALGVGFSTFLSAPVTILAAICAIVFGFFSADIRVMNAPGTDGGGPIESLVRLITQRNMQVVMEETPGTLVMKEADRVFTYTLDSITQIVPSFAQMDFSSFLTYGYFIDVHRLLVALAVALAFSLGLAVLGYFCLKTRELAG